VSMAAIPCSASPMRRPSVCRPKCRRNEDWTLSRSRISPSISAVRRCSPAFRHQTESHWRRGRPAESFPPPGAPRFSCRCAGQKSFRVGRSAQVDRLRSSRTPPTRF
jgi:hypothetical protein